MKVIAIPRRERERLTPGALIALVVEWVVPRNKYRATSPGSSCCTRNENRAGRCRRWELSINDRFSALFTRSLRASASREIEAQSFEPPLRHNSDHWKVQIRDLNFSEKVKKRSSTACVLARLMSMNSNIDIYAREFLLCYKLQAFTTTFSKLRTVNNFLCNVRVSIFNFSCVFSSRIVNIVCRS